MLLRRKYSISSTNKQKVFTQLHSSGQFIVEKHIRDENSEQKQTF